MSDIKASELVADYRRHECSATASIGKCTVYLTNILGHVRIGVNWFGLGTVDIVMSMQFANDLMACNRLAIECERLLVEAGYTIQR